MEFDITQIVVALIGVIAAVVTAVVIPWIRSKTTAQQRIELVKWAQIGVNAAELIYQGIGRGEEKREYVAQWLKEKGITYDEQTIRNAIEDAVMILNGGVAATENVIGFKG